MGEQTKIEWCDHTWSPWRGCTKVSDGCRYCYAETLSKRNPRVLGVWGPHGTRVVNADWKKPLSWDRKADREGRRIRVFPSLCDPFEDREDLDEPLARFLQLVENTTNLDWLLLTKRPELFVKRLRAALAVMPERSFSRWNELDRTYGQAFPSNVWPGISAENQDRADERIPKLLEIPAETRWLSLEPLLGPIDLSRWLGDGIHWVVVGGESGKDARPCHLEWIREALWQCQDAGVPCFVKQVGSEPRPSQRIRDFKIRYARHPKGGDPAEWPEDLQVRGLPEGWF